MLFGIPVWVYFCILFIFVSGYMTIRSMQAEHKREQKFIEKEGEVYLSRMEKEKEKRRAMTSE